MLQYKYFKVEAQGALLLYFQKPKSQTRKIKKQYTKNVCNNNNKKKREFNPLFTQSKKKETKSLCRFDKRTKNKNKVFCFCLFFLFYSFVLALFLFFFFVLRRIGTREDQSQQEKHPTFYLSCGDTKYSIVLYYFFIAAIILIILHQHNHEG